MRFVPALVLSIFSLASYVTHAGIQADSLIAIDELTFSSDLEKQLFVQLAEGSPDYFGLFMVLNNSISAADLDFQKSKFNAEVQLIEKTGVVEKKAPKQIKTVYKKIHEAFLEQYRLENHFSDIFKDGEFNCVSASALYALAFDQLEIPYVIKEKPTHVYLVAYPESEKILVESTNPAFGYLTFNDGYKRTFIEKLEKSKIISQRETSTKTTDELFDKYFFSDKDIDIEQLVAIQYMNDGIYLLDQRKFKDAFHQFQKAYYLYPHDRAEFLMFIAASAHLAGLDHSSIEYADFVIQFSFFSKFGVTSSQMKDEFVELSKVWLFQKSDTAQFSSVYRDFLTLYSDSTFINEINFLYNFQNAVYFGKQSKKKQAYIFIKDAYTANPADIQAQDYFIELSKDKAFKNNNIEKAVKEIESDLLMFPKLREVPKFTDILLMSYLQATHKSFYEGKGKKGFEYLVKFEKLIASVDENNVSEEAIGIAYSSAAMDYFKRGYKSKAKLQLKKGLLLSPENQIILDRLRYLSY